MQTYEERVKDLCKCTDAQAAKVVGIMRAMYSTLDRLDDRSFKMETKLAWTIVKVAHP